MWQKSWNIILRSWKWLSVREKNFSYPFSSWYTNPLACVRTSAFTNSWGASKIIKIGPHGLLIYIFALGPDEFTPLLGTSPQLWTSLDSALQFRTQFYRLHTTCVKICTTVNFSGLYSAFLHWDLMSFTPGEGFISKLWMVRILLLVFLVDWGEFISLPFLWVFIGVLQMG